MREIRIETADGTMDARVFVPAGHDGGARPAVVLFTDIGGLRPAYDGKAQRIADGGYAVLMPNVYYRAAPGQVVPDGKSFRDPDVMPTLREYGTALTPDAQERDFAAIVAALEGDAAFAAERIGVVGYCMTGGFALRMAAAHPDRVAAAAGFHSARLAPEGVADAPVSVAGRIRARVYLGHADKDEHLPAAEIGRVDRALAEAGVHFATELFKGAGHGWTTRDAPSYHPDADALHYARIFWFLGEAMGSGSAGGR